MSDVLDPDEREALQAVEDAEPDEGEMSSYNLTGENITLRRYMPALEVINKHIQDDLSEFLQDFVRSPLAVEVESVEMLSFDDFVQTQEIITCINYISAKPLHGLFVTNLTAELIFQLVNLYFGASNTEVERDKDQPFSITEMNLAKQMMDAMCVLMSEAWKDVVPLDMQVDKVEYDTEYSKEFAPAEMLIVTTMSILINEKKSMLHVLLPLSSIEPIKEPLRNIEQGDHPIQNTAWSKKFTEGVIDAELEVVARLTDVKVRVGDLVAFKAGDIIPIEMPDHIILHAGGTAILDGKFGASNGHKAVQLNQWLVDPH
ncbi:MAG: flagellar motor switch protein FliM [Pseudomonadales bacterium]|nr:flagellar motor switch protein FliM [Pseudomonadales bacterium]